MAKEYDNTKQAQTASNPLIEHLRKVLHHGAGFTQLEAYTIFKEYDAVVKECDRLREQRISEPTNAQ